MSARKEMEGIVDEKTSNYAFGSSCTRWWSEIMTCIHCGRSLPLEGSPLSKIPSL